MARPAAGPSAMPTATARLSSTTGEGDTMASRRYSAAMRAQPVSATEPARMAGGDRGLQSVRLQVGYAPAEALGDGGRGQ